MAITNTESMNYYKLKPGAIVSIHNLKKHERARMFLLIPYIKNYKENYELLNDLSKSINDLEKIKIINNEYKKRINDLKFTFKILRHDPKGLKVIEEVYIEELLGLHDERINLTQEEYYDLGRLAMPESWINDNEISLGETVMVRDDQPSPIIF